jgi:glycosyltransferase involved in cell wall biosynthesis
MFPLGRWLNRCIHFKFYAQKLLEYYDLVVGHIPFARYAPFYWRKFHRPYIIYDAGMIRYLHSPDYVNTRSPILPLTRDGYRNAARIIFTNVDTYPLFIKHGYDPQKLVYSPFAVDTELYAPKPELAERNDAPVFFMPMRPDPMKGKPLALKAFARYVKRKPKARLWMIDWGNRQLEQKGSQYLTEKKMVEALGIAGNVDWLPGMPKHELVRRYNMADAIIDQLIVGGFGTTVHEALSCSKPVVGYADESAWLRFHGSVPPVLQARDTDEVYERMVELENPSTRKYYGSRGRKWVEETCEMKTVARQQLQVYQEVLKH